MIKISWTCPKCGLWTNVNREHLETVGSIPQLICKMCEHNATDELTAGEPAHHVTSIPMIRKEATLPNEGMELDSVDPVGKKHFRVDRSG